ncbi:MAG TPA: hypothetical protein VLJ17_16210 [Xanthobacteraceae bacterium]|nr:hypothetical protein [Xanthobacteraceae bacterium]
MRSEDLQGLLAEEVLDRRISTKPPSHLDPFVCHAAREFMHFLGQCTRDEKSGIQVVSAPAEGYGGLRMVFANAR